VGDGPIAAGGSESSPTLWVASQTLHGSGHRDAIFWRNHDAAKFDYLSYITFLVCACHNRAAARQHIEQLRRHVAIHDAPSSRQQVNVTEIEQLIQPLRRLQWQEVNVSEAAAH
jgi:hypothetical protein